MGVTKTAKSAQGTVASTSTATSLGNFVFTPELGSLSGDISLTDNDGNTYVYATGQTSAGQELPASSLTLHATATLKYTVAYDGSLTSAGDINAAWLSYWNNAGASGLTLRVTDDSSTVTPLPEGKTRVSTATGKEEGLKLKSSAFGTPGGTNSYVGASYVDFSITAESLKALSWTEPDSVLTAPSKQDVGTVYVAIKGINGLAQVDTTYYHMTAAFQ